MKSQTCIRRLHILRVFSIACVLSCWTPFYSSTIPTVSLHCPTGPLQRTPPPHTPLLYPPYPSTVPTVPLHCTLPTVPFFCVFLSTNLALLSTNLALLSTNFALLSTTFLGTVGRVRWYGAVGTVARCKGYSGTVQRVQWYSAEGTVVECRGYSGTGRRLR